MVQPGGRGDHGLETSHPSIWWTGAGYPSLDPKTLGFAGPPTPWETMGKDSMGWMEGGMDGWADGPRMYPGTYHGYPDELQQ